jgi:hypothetical protein
LNHQIRISGAGPYAVSGTVVIASTSSPITDAAKMLILEADDHDTLSVVGGDFNFSPMPIGKLAAPRRPPLRSDVERMLKTMARN